MELNGIRTIRYYTVDRIELWGRIQKHCLCKCTQSTSDFCIKDVITQSHSLLTIFCPDYAPSLDR